MTSPSCRSSRDPAGMLPGDIPPTSAWWARRHGVRGEPPVEGDGGDERDVGKVRPAAIGIVDRPDLARHAVPGPHRRDRLGHRAQVHRDRRRLHHHAPVGVEDGGAAVTPFGDVGAVRRPDQRRLHLLGHRAKRVGHDLQGDAVHHADRSRTIAPEGLGDALHPGASQPVAPSRANAAGPASGTVGGAPAMLRDRRRGGWPRGGSTPPRPARPGSASP